MTAEEAKSLAYEFGNFYLDVQRRVLVEKGSNKPIATNERNLLFLQLLCENSPKTVSKDTLTQAIWPNSHVSDWSLPRIVSDTRQLLHDDGDSQQLIKTVRGVGFLIKDVQRVPTTRLKSSAFFSSKMGYLFSFVLFGVIIVAAYLLYAQVQSQQSLLKSMEALANYQDNTYTAFVAQAKRRNELVAMLEKRLAIKREHQFEKFFSLYYLQFNKEEQFVCAQMRAITETGLKENNERILALLNSQPKILDEIAQAKALQQHLRFWLNKYESVFKKREDMCLLYVVVEDNVPYPSGVDQSVKAWLAENIE
ncbi:winged helix-turn-helix domain-containing protein [Agaribacter flavus]|uniref:Transcriptional regulator n=1 Tax=Agaribacter flavus TaxID=1902781 RepID=A0ABV7FR25_9ALTE